MHQHPRFTATALGVLAGLAMAVGEVGSTLHYLQTIPAGFGGLPLPANLDWIFGWTGVERALTAVTAPWEMQWIEGADHSFHVLKSSGTTDSAVMDRIATTSAAWLDRLPEITRAG